MIVKARKKPLALNSKNAQPFMQRYAEAMSVRNPFKRYKAKRSLFRERLLRLA